MGVMCVVALMVFFICVIEELTILAEIRVEMTDLTDLTSDFIRIRRVDIC